MSPVSLDASLKWLAAADRRLLAGGLRGIEKECLRVGADGRLSERPHSSQFGSALTHPWLTTDYSEALLELVTPPLGSATEALGFLEDLHAFIVKHAGDELLWPMSMPCIVGADESVPLAQYGSSNEGRFRTIYRSGLGLRYGRSMQAIAGAHFNYSVADDFWPAYRDHLGSSLDGAAFKSECLMGLVRNFRRYGWLVSYLFGASPAFCKSFRPDGHPRLKEFDASTWYGPHSTSLRMSDMGYRNSTQARLSISADSLDDFLAELEQALGSVEPRYEAIGVEVDGEYRQLNANVLQLENEYYSSIRPKPASKKPRLITALRETGVEYVEVRTLDLNPFVPVGIAAEQTRLIEVLLLYCLLSDSPPISAAEQTEIDQRELAVAWEGRRPGLLLPAGGSETSLSECALAIVDGMAAIANLLDDADSSYSGTVAAARAAAEDPGATLSARVLDELSASGHSFFDWSFEIANRQREHYLGYQFAPGRLEALERLAAESLAEARALETVSEPPFAEYLADFLASGMAENGVRKRQNL